LQIYPLDWQLGHLIAMSHANELRNKTWNKKHRRKKISIYCINGPVASRYAIQKMQESVMMLQGNFAWLLIQVSKFAPGIRAHFPSDRGFGTNYESTPLVKFSKNEIESGSNLIGRYKPLVCLNVRDAAYNSFVSEKFGFQSPNWTNRNSDIYTYLDAAEFLATNGHTVFRMGAKVESSFASQNPKIIDYANNGMRTEFLDFYLAHECHFSISTCSGWDEIPTMFQRPLLLVNHYDFLMTISKNCVIYPKLLFNKYEERLISLSETIDLHLSGKTNQKKHSLKEFGIEVIDMTSECLVDAVTEMAQRVEGTFVETPEQKELQAKLKYILSINTKLQPSPNYYPIRAQFASCFLSQYPDFCH
jgi:putative glycosyltransferase (TIGR04372 family)